MSKQICSAILSTLSFIIMILINVFVSFLFSQQYVESVLMKNYQRQRNLLAETISLESKDYKYMYMKL